ncbi:MAG: peptidase dimerization domain-containing protein [Paracoccaceae bacterium]
MASPTDNRAVPGHKGALWLRLVFHGVTAHGSAPEAGVNAIEVAMVALAAIRQIDLGRRIR